MLRRAREAAYRGAIGFYNGEIPVSVEVGREFHGYLVVRIIESDFDFVICVQDKAHPETTLSSNRIMKHSVNRVAYQ